MFSNRTLSEFMAADRVSNSFVTNLLRFYCDLLALLTWILLKMFKAFLSQEYIQLTGNLLVMKITYIIGHYNPSVGITDLVSHTTYVVCVNFIYRWRDLQFKVDSERQIFWETFHSNLFTLRVFARNLLRGNRRRNIFRISFWRLAWNTNPVFSSYKPTHYLLDHGDFIWKIRLWRFETKNIRVGKNGRKNIK